MRRDHHFTANNMYCQKCRTPLKLDGSLESLNPATFDLLIGNLSTSILAHLITCVITPANQLLRLMQALQVEPFQGTQPTPPHPDPSIRKNDGNSTIGRPNRTRHPFTEDRYLHLVMQLGVKAILRDRAGETAGTCPL